MLIRLLNTARWNSDQLNEDIRIQLFWWWFINRMPSTNFGRILNLIGSGDASSWMPQILHPPHASHQANLTKVKQTQFPKRTACSGDAMWVNPQDSPTFVGGKEGAQEACSGIRGGVIGMLIRQWDQRSGPGNLHSRDDHLLEWPLPGLCHIRSLKDIVRDPEPNPESPALVLILDLDLWSFIHEMILVQDSSFIRRLWVSLAWAPVQWNSCTTPSFVHYRRRWLGAHMGALHL